MWQLLPPTALLLVVSADLQAAGLPKAVVVLDPQWVRVLEDDSVTLKCQGSYPSGNNSTMWLHNGNLISSQASSYIIKPAKVENSGEYRCQTGGSALSDPVKLEVHQGWLVLQTRQWVFQEGETIWLRCHSWKNTSLLSVSYLQNGQVKKFNLRNFDFHIPDATYSHSGSYFCRGLIGGRKNESSKTVDIIVQGLTIPSIHSSPPWHQVAFCLVMVVLFAVDTGLYFSVQRNLRSSVGSWKDHKFKWSKDPQGK
ncbi:low affinity immunoglobulin gamma Fc region receptor III-A-like isoform X2 [Cynocephalus volans]|uniref:low affinity immunoglobulin gamma Fc region receptor III-A-like isoform X2 n=1 Tax=Cynocephalus volans TaxID=110931 RepID=UPI002FCA6AC9